jgi:hypothetical protein
VKFLKYLKENKGMLLLTATTVMSAVMAWITGPIHAY